jgi:anti-anti-sigma factor
VAGDLDLATVSRLDDAIARLDGETVLDLGGVSFVDSSGLHALVRARSDRPALRIENVAPNVRRVFDLAGVTGVLLGDGTASDGTASDGTASDGVRREGG